MFRKALFFILIGVSAAMADTTYRFEIYGSSTVQEWNDLSPFNPNNDVLQIPTWTHTLELRPDLQLGLGANHSFVLRSRHFLDWFQRDYTNPDETKYKNKADSDLTDAFFSSNWNDVLSTTIGLQNYQWGPAEIFSPSNPFFHFGNNQRSFFYKEKGRVLVRANWNPSPKTTNWSVVLMSEPVNNQTTFWTADKDFKPRSAVKIEYQFDNPANAIAILGGQTDNERGFVGEYATWSPVEGTSIYFDAQQHAGRTNYVPVKNNFGLYDMVESQSEDIYTLAVVGVRWEGRVDFRQEFIYNQAGFNDEEWKNARASAITLSPNILTNSGRFGAPGLEFRTQAYSYTSVRIPDLGLSKMASLSARWLSSLYFDSGVLQFNFEYNWNDNTVLSAEVIQFTGNPANEFRIIDNKQASLGFRWTY